MSIWAQNNALPMPQVTYPGADIPCPSNIETLAFQSNTWIAPAGASCYPWLIASMLFTLGATAPSALQIIFQIAGSTTLNTYLVAPALLVNSAVLQVNFQGLGVSSRATWRGSGNSIGVQVTPTGQPVTVTAVGTSYFTGLSLGTDI